MTLKGLPVLVGIACILLNFVVQFVPALAWFAQTNFFLHLGLVVALGGILLGDVW
ncbi:MAG: hypothetical protein H5T59_11420 [Anaerolineae bacterium]|nr:hypothetical protein [Anaerolineae bacterium]